MSRRRCSILSPTRDGISRARTSSSMPERSFEALMLDLTELRRDTVALHAGRDPDGNHGVVNPPVYHCSTVIFPTVETLLETRRDRASGAYVGFTYGREGTRSEERRV